MLLTTDLRRSPNLTGNPEQSLRSTIASLYLARKINLHIIARRNDVPRSERWMILYNARTIERVFQKYQALAAAFNFDYLAINTRVLELAACSIATHYIQGEYEQARRRRDEALAAEAELSVRRVRAALERDLGRASDSDSTTTALAA